MPILETAQVSISISMIGQTPLLPQQPGPVVIPLGTLQVDVTVHITSTQEVGGEQVIARCALLQPSGLPYANPTDSDPVSMPVPGSQGVDAIVRNLPLPPDWVAGTCILSAFLLKSDLSDEVADPVGGYKLKRPALQAP
jgi:hypothetical protein